MLIVPSCNFLYLYHCNRHAIATVALPLKYSNLEIGDVVEFDKIVNNTSMLGYYAEVKLKNSSTAKAELFALSSEVAISSK